MAGDHSQHWPLYLGYGLDSEALVKSLDNRRAEIPEIMSHAADDLKMHARSRRLAQLDLEPACRGTGFDTQRDRVMAALQARLGFLRSEGFAIDPNMRRLG